MTIYVKNKLKKNEKINNSVRGMSHLLIHSELTMDGIMLTDISGCVQFVNDSWARMHGYAADEVVGKNFNVFFNESLFNNDVEPFLPKLDEEGTCQGEVSHISKGGSVFKTWTTSTSMEDAAGIIVGILWTARRIEEQDEAEHLYEKLAKSSYTSIYIVQDRRVKFLNHVGETFGGLSADEIIGLEDSLSFVYPDDRDMVRNNAIAMLKGKRTSPYEFRCIGRDGNVRWLLETITSINYQGRRAFLGNAMEITELVEARNKVEEFKDLSSSILDATPHATFGLEDRRIIFANEAVASVFGWKPEELIGKLTRVLYPTEKGFKEIGMRGYGTLEKQRSFVATEFPCKHKDGKIIICRINAARIGQSLTSKKIVVTYEDITEQKKVEEKLHESEELYRSLAERSFAGVYLVQNGIFRFINKNAASYAGYTQKELVGRKSYSIVHPEDRKMVKRNAEEMLKGERTSPYEFRIITPKGDIRWIMETVTPITVMGRSAVLGNSMNITELKDAKSKLEEFMDLESSILDATPHAIFSLQERKIIFANDAVKSVFGWTPEELIGKSTRVLYPADEDFERLGQKAYSALERKRNFTEPEFPCWHKDGRVITCRINASRIGQSLQKRKVVVTYEDITEQKAAEEALRERQNQLEIQTRNLEKINTTLNVLLKKREDDKKVLKENILSNVRGLIMPGVEMIKKCKMDNKSRMCVDMIESNLNAITSPFLRTLSSKYLKLTPKEILVAGLLKDGKATKEIAEMLNASVRGIEFHRENIRKKLGLKNKKENLTSYLMIMSSDD